MPRSKPRPLEAGEIQAALANLPGWSGDQNGLEKTFVFADFRAAMSFMHACVEGIESRDHHPSWCNRYKSVEVQLNTGEAGHRVTERDIDLAAFLNAQAT